MNAQDHQSQGPLGIICGSGSLPFAVADAVIGRNREVVLFGLKGIADASRMERYRHQWMSVTEAGKLLADLRQHGCRDIVFIGRLSRPPMRTVRMGFRSLLLLPKLIAAFRGGDDHLLKSMSKVIESEGFRVFGAHEVAPEILMPEGQMTRHAPSERDKADIAIGFDLLRQIGPYDVGQAAVVGNRHVLAIEGPEGTDEMLARVAALRQRGRIQSPSGRGVLVKAPKPQQDRRFDLPAIGPKTADAVKAAGLGGIAVLAGETVVAEPEILRGAADAAGLFVVGMTAAH